MEPWWDDDGYVPLYFKYINKFKVVEVPGTLGCHEVVVHGVIPMQQFKEMCPKIAEAMERSVMGVE